MVVLVVDVGLTVSDDISGMTGASVVGIGFSFLGFISLIFLF